MDLDTEILLDCTPFLRQYKSGRIERLMGTNVVPPSTDPLTGVTTKDITIQTTGLSARLYLPPSPSSSTNKLPILVDFHGGAFCVGSASNPNPFLTSLVAKTPLIALSIDYRLAPEHLLPAAYDDCWSALQWLVSVGGGMNEPSLAEHGDFTRIFLAGDSAGANIVHNMAMQAGKTGQLKFAGVVLGHPYFWGREAVGAETADEEVRRKVEGLWKLVGLELEDERVNPLLMSETEVEEEVKEGFGRVMVWVAEKDLLAERGKAYGEWAKTVVGVEEVEVVETEGEDHVFYYWKPECEKALVLVDKMVAFVNKS